MGGAAEIVPWPGDPNYGVTRAGEVYRIVRSHDHGRHVPARMKPRPDRDGYFLTGLSMKVHRLVAETFLPNPDGKPEVAHRNGVKTDNRVENLRWATRKENEEDKVLHGTRLRGERVPVAKLTEEQVRDARRRAAQGESHTSIAEDVDVDRSVLSRAIRGATWAHVSA